MQQTQFSTKEALCPNGCLVVIRVLLVHVAAVQALLSWVPAPWLGALCIYLTGLITGTEISATAISAAVSGVSHDTPTRLLSSGWWTARLVLLAGGTGGEQGRGRGLADPLQLLPTGRPEALAPGNP